MCLSSVRRINVQSRESPIKPAVVANKTDLCSDSPPPLPDIEYGQPVHTPPTSDSSPETSSHLKPRAVTAAEGAMFAKEHGLLYVETSAKEGWHVVDAFEWTAREVLATISQADLDRRKVSAAWVDV